MSLPQMSLSGAVMILAVVVIRALAINRFPKKAFLALWGVAVVRLLIPYSLCSPFSVYSLLGRLPAAAGAANGSPFVPSAPAAPAFTPAAPAYSVIPMPGTAAADTAAPAAADPWVAVWAVGALACGAFFVTAYWKCRREFQASLPVENEYAGRWLSEHRIFRAIEIRQSGRISAPLTYGVLRPVILMPKTADWGDRDTLKYVLAHEYVHIRRFDAVTKLALTAALCVHWFNPAVWIMYALANRDIELSCDEAVIRRFGERTKSAYAMTLIRMEETRSDLSPLCNSFSKNAIEERIIAIMKMKKASLFTLLAAAALVVGVTIAFATAPGTAKVDWKDVLSGSAQFLYVSEGSAEPKYISDVPALFDPDDDYMKIWEFAVLDLDGDGQTEVVLCVVGVANDMGGSLILHRIGDRIYGYSAKYRAMTDLKADGTFSYSDPTGMAEGGICSIRGFTGTGYTVDKITYGQGSYAGWDTFVVDHQPAEEEEFFAAEQAQRSKADAVWYDFAGLADLEPDDTSLQLR